MHVYEIEINLLFQKYQSAQKFHTLTNLGSKNQVTAFTHFKRDARNNDLSYLLHWEPIVDPQDLLIQL